MVKPVNRKCQGCGKIFDRDNLLKITLFDGKLYINPSSKILGRSVYICKNGCCIKNFIKKKRIYQGLKFKNFEEIERVHRELTELSKGF